MCVCVCIFMSECVFVFVYGCMCMCKCDCMCMREYVVCGMHSCTLYLQLCGLYLCGYVDGVVV